MKKLTAYIHQYHPKIHFNTSMSTSMFSAMTTGRQKRTTAVAITSSVTWILSTGTWLWLFRTLCFLLFSTSRAVPMKIYPTKISKIGTDTAKLYRNIPDLVPCGASSVMLHLPILKNSEACLIYGILDYQN